MRRKPSVIHNCKVCGKILKTKPTLRCHMKTHDNARPHGCKLCSKRFLRRADLQKHSFVHSRIKTESCIFCKKTFSLSSVLYRHLRIHINEKYNWCSVCGEEFLQPAHLKDHKTIHCNDTRLKCSECFTYFRHSSSLRRHEKLHRNRVAFKCVICAKSLYSKFGLLEHIRVHLNEKFFGCLICKKDFKRKFELDRHMRNNECKNRQSVLKRKSSPSTETIRLKNHVSTTTEVQVNNLAPDNFMENPLVGARNPCESLNGEEQESATSLEQIASEPDSEVEIIHETGPCKVIKRCGVCGEVFFGEKADKRYAMHIVARKHYIMSYD